MSFFSDFSHKPRKHKVLVSTCVILAALFILLLLGYFLESGKAPDQVMKDGQRVLIDIATGTVTGGMTPEPESTSEKPPAEEAKTPKAEVVPEETADTPIDETSEDAKLSPALSEPEPADTVQEESGEVDPYAAFVGGEETVSEDAPSEAENASPSDNELPASTSGSSAATGSDTIPAYPRTAASLAAINPVLQEKVVEGMLPRISKQGVRPADFYARPFIADEQTPTITLIISNLGLNKRATELALDLPVDVSLSFDPYAEYTPIWAESARHQGHEVWLDAPLQAADYPASDPGELGLLTDATDEENLQRIKELLTTFPGYVGLTAAPNEALSTNRKAMTILISVLKQRGVTLMLGNRDASIVGSPIVTTNGNTVTVADAVIDRTLNTETIRRQLETLEAIAKDKGIATGMAHAYPLSLREIKAWIPTLRQKGILLAPMSAAPQLQ